VEVKCGGWIGEVSVRITLKEVKHQSCSLYATTLI